jgi:hypothetical protein
MNKILGILLGGLDGRWDDDDKDINAAVNRMNLPSTTSTDRSSPPNAETAATIAQVEQQQQQAIVNFLGLGLSPEQIAIALANNAIVVTRNHRDFSQVTGLNIEDWTQ